MPSPSATFSLEVILGYGVDRQTEAKLNKACPSSSSHGTFAEMENFFARTYTSLTSNLATTTERRNSSNSIITSKLPQEQFFVVSASNVHLAMDPYELFWKTTSTNHLAIFIPPQMIGTFLEKYYSAKNTSGSSFWIQPPVSADFAQDLLPKIHPSLANCSICGIIMTTLAENGPADILLLEFPKEASIHDMLRQTNGVSISAMPSCILKMLPVTTVNFVNDDKDQLPAAAAAAAASPNHIRDGSEVSTHKPKAPPTSSMRRLIPTCPVCIHRIDPIWLGLPAPTNEHICSRFCPSPISSSSAWLLHASTEDNVCAKQKFLQQWALPARCKACSIIRAYWDFHKLTTRERNDEVGDLFCESCSMHKTLWTCLTCGFVGCGRYSNKHSVAHFEQTRHPYSLELATLRVWDYCLGEDGGFVQRSDLLECPSSPPLSHPWMIRGLDHDGISYESEQRSREPTNGVEYESASGLPPMEVEKSSKKAVMVGEEYEALLQSALEEQAQHYEGEIIKVRAELTAALVDKNSMSPEEAKEIAELNAGIERTRKDIDSASKGLLEAQALEAGLRAASQRLFSEQKASNELLKKIQEEHKRENEQGTVQIEDLEQQIADLSANLRMRHQFSQNDELNNAQIFGTTTSPDTKQSSGRRGKKKGRMFRK